MTSRLPIVGPQGVTPEWITAALTARGIDATVSALRAETVGTGQLGETRRFLLDYAGTPPPDAPLGDRSCHRCWGCDQNARNCSR